MKPMNKTLPTNISNFINISPKGRNSLTAKEIRKKLKDNFRPTTKNNILNIKCH